MINANRSQHPLQRMMMSHSEMPQQSMMQGESVMDRSNYDDTALARELVGLLDAFYDANRRS